MKLSVDLHIHSCLSPCADKGMTPNNIVNMAILKGLDIIAVTDHNSGENVPALLECAKNKDLIVVPGMELETLEEVHIICLFPDINSLYSFQSFVYENMPPLKNRPEIFGRQIIMNSDDEETGECDKMLITACNISVVDVFSIVSDLGGTAYPAHIDRDSYSVLVNLGGVPDSYKGRYLELSYHLKNTSSRKRCGRDWKSVLDSLKEDGFALLSHRTPIIWEYS